MSAELRAIDADLDGLAKLERGATRRPDGRWTSSAPSPPSGPARPRQRRPPRPPASWPHGHPHGRGRRDRVPAACSRRDVILRGGELVIRTGSWIRRPAAARRDPGERPARHVETAFTFDLGFIKVRPEQPDRHALQVARRAVNCGTRADRRTGPSSTSRCPVFDPSRATGSTCRPARSRRGSARRGAARPGARPAATTRPTSRSRSASGVDLGHRPRRHRSRPGSGSTRPSCHS